MKGTGVLSVVCLAILMLPASATAGEDGGRARYVPWSGYWWPVRKAAMLQPLHKYDLITGRHAASREARSKPPGSAASWWGYCHAWSAASLLEREPRTLTSVRTHSGGLITLGIGDQKGLLTVAHDGDAAHVYGRRYAGRSGDDYQDIYPDVLWKYLRLHVKQQGVPLILDIAAGREVWNYPVYQYQVEYRPLGDGRQLARMKLLMADDAVPPSFIGTRVKAKTYLFTFRMQGGALVLGSGRWAGASIRDHPDFAWYPTVIRPRNTEIKYGIVKSLIPSARSRDEEPLPPDLAEIAAGRAVPVSAAELGALLTFSGPNSFKVQLALTPVKKNPATVGELYYARGISEQDGYLYLFHTTADGDVRLLYPMPDQDNRVSGDREFELGGPGSATRWDYPAKPGTFRVTALVTSRPLLLDRLDPEDAGGEPGVPGRRFRWEPAEREIVAVILKEVYAGRMTSARLTEETGIDPKELVKEFARQGWAIEVGPPLPQRED